MASMVVIRERRLRRGGLKLLNVHGRWLIYRKRQRRSPTLGWLTVVACVTLVRSATGLLLTVDLDV